MQQSLSQHSARQSPRPPQSVPHTQAPQQQQHAPRPMPQTPLQNTQIPRQVPYAHMLKNLRNASNGQPVPSPRLQQMTPQMTSHAPSPRLPQLSNHPSPRPMTQSPRIQPTPQAYQQQQFTGAQMQPQPMMPMGFPLTAQQQQFNLMRQQVQGRGGQMVEKRMAGAIRGGQIGRRPMMPQGQMQGGQPGYQDFGINIAQSGAMMMGGMRPGMQPQQGQPGQQGGMGRGR